MAEAVEAAGLHGGRAAMVEVSAELRALYRALKRGAEGPEPWADPARAAPPRAERDPLGGARPAAGELAVAARPDPEGQGARSAADAAAEAGLAEGGREREESAGPAPRRAEPSPYAAAPLRPLRLRRDGRRPLAAEAARLLLREDRVHGWPGGPEIRARLSLDLAADGRVLAGIALVPEEGAALRPLHAASVLAGPGDLAALARALDPALMLPWREPDAPAAEPCDPAGFRRRLRRRLDDLIAAARAAAAVPQTSESGDPR